MNPSANPLTPAEPAILATGARFRFNSTKFYVPVVTWPIKDNIQYLGNIKQRFKRMSWSSYRSEITAQPKNNLDYLIDQHL